MTNFRVRAQTWLVASLLAASATGMAGCIKIGEDGLNFIVVNHTNQTLTIVPRTQAPGQPPDSYSSGADQPFTLMPGASGGERDSLSPGTCLYQTFSAYDSTGKLIATDPTPICEDAHGHGGTWTITTK